MTPSKHERSQLTGIVSTLAASDAFSALDQKTLEALARTAELKSLKKDEYFFRKGDMLDGFFVIQSGYLNLHRVTAKGRKFVIHVFGPLSSFGAHAIVYPDPCSTDAVALESTKLVFLPKTPFLGLCKMNPEILVGLIRSMTSHVRILLHNVYASKNNRTISRLAFWIMDNMHRQANAGIAPGVTISIPAGHGALASELGVTRETLSRTLSTLRREGVINYTTKTITINNMPVLQAYADGIV